MDCPDDDLIARQLRGALDAETAAAVDAHVVDCSACRELFVELGRLLPSSDDAQEGRALAGGDRVGRYAIVDAIGRGAMGVVYRAEDRELRRAVAIKVVSPRIGEDASSGRARLLREAQAMARLQHPNVVRVFDVGTVGADVFVAMELVEGSTLGAWLARRTHTRAELLAVFDGIARGLAAAHEAGVVHRDVKPDNVLVREDDHPLVADFGLARGALGEALESLPEATEQGAALSSSLTRTGAVVGTPRYMAPEQLVPGRRVDYRSDQFAYCVMLFEALYGAHPFPATSLVELCDAVLEGKPTIPDGASVPAELRRVVLRGLAVDPAARWPSMRALADALRPRSRRSVAYAAALGLVVLATAVAWVGRDGPTTLCVDPDAAVAEVSIGDTLVDARLDAWSHAWVAAVRSTCEAADRPEHDVVLQCLLRRRAEVGAVLEQADASEPAKLIDAIGGLAPPELCARSDREPAVPAELAAAVAELRGELDRVRARLLVGRASEALAEGTRARDRAESLAWDPLLAEAEIVLADAAIAAGDDAQAEASLRRAVDLAEAAGADAIAVDALIDLADVVGTRGSRFEAGVQAIRHAQSLLDRDTADPRAQIRLLTVEGRMKLERHDFAGSRDCAERALAAGEGVLDPHAPLMLEARSQLAMAHIQLDAYDEAEHMLLEVLEVQEQVYGDTHPRLTETLTRLAIVYKRRHRYDDAIHALERALAAAEALNDPMSPTIGMILSNMGLVHVEAMQLDAALPELARALAIYRAAEGDYGPRVATLEFHNGEALREAKRFAEAQPHLERAHAIESELYGPDDARTIASAHAIAGLHIDQGDYATAEAELRECLAACGRAGAAGEHLRPDLLSNLAHALHRQGRFVEARDTMQESIALAIARGEQGSSFFANKQHGLGEVLLDLGDHEGAAAALEIAVDLRTELGDAMLPYSQQLLERARAGR